MYHPSMDRSLRLLLTTTCLLLGCNQDAATTDVSPDAPEPVPEKRCGESRETLFSAYSVDDLAAYADCTVLIGHFQEDSVSGLQDLAALKNVHTIEGTINIFRSPGFVTLHGLENLQVVDGNLYIHLNPNLESLRALMRLHTVKGNLLVNNNDLVPPEDLMWLDGRVAVGGSKVIE
jgi:hypothetical protein